MLSNNRQSLSAVHVLAINSAVGDWTKLVVGLVRRVVEAAADAPAVCVQLALRGK